MRLEQMQWFMSDFWARYIWIYRYSCICSNRDILSLYAEIQISFGTVWRKMCPNRKQLDIETMTIYFFSISTEDWKKVTIREATKRINSTYTIYLYSYAVYIYSSFQLELNFEENTKQKMFYRTLALAAINPQYTIEPKSIRTKYGV